jgi:hypothetical protein
MVTVLYFLGRIEENHENPLLRQYVDHQIHEEGSGRLTAYCNIQSHCISQYLGSDP